MTAAVDTSLDYAQYLLAGGTCSQADFTALLPAAQALVRAECWPRVATTAAQADAWREAVTRAIDVDAAWGGTHGAASGGSWTVGGVSETAGAGDGGGYSDELRAAVRGALVGSGLLCKVVV